MNEGAVDAVRAWIEDSGRALELRTARAFQRAGADVLLSSPYLDSSAGEQKVREADVTADFGWTSYDLPAHLRASVECKNSTKHPWVIFYGDDSESSFEDLEKWTVFAYGNDTRMTSGLASIWLGRAPFTESRTADLVVAAHAGTSNPASDAVRQALSAAHHQQQLFLQNQGTARQAVLVVAVVITMAPLFACWLDGSGALVLQRVEQADVWGHAKDGSRRRVYIRNEATLQEFAEGLRERAFGAGKQAARAR